jgi:hypothetical protein
VRGTHIVYHTGCARKGAPGPLGPRFIPRPKPEWRKLLPQQSNFDIGVRARGADLQLGALLWGTTMKRLVSAFAGCLLLALPARAELTARELLTQYDDRIALAIVTGMGIGFSWYNGGASVQFGQQLYCQPDKLSITPQQFLAILRRHVRENPRDEYAPVGLAMLSALEATFPCRK